MSSSLRELLDRVLKGDPQAEAELEESMRKPREVSMSYRVSVDTPELEIRFDPPFVNIPVITAHWESNETIDSPAPLRSIGRLMPSPFNFPVIAPLASSPLGNLQLLRLPELSFQEFIPPLSLDIPQLTFEIPIDFLDITSGFPGLIGEIRQVFISQIWKFDDMIRAKLKKEIEDNLIASVILSPVLIVMVSMMNYMFQLFREGMARVIFVLFGDGGYSHILGIPVSELQSGILGNAGMFMPVIQQLGDSIQDVQKRLTDVFTNAVKKSSEITQAIQKQVYEKTNLITERVNTVSGQLNNTVLALNMQVSTLEGQLNQLFGRLNSINGSLINAVNSLSAGFSAMGEATNEENSQIGEFINENLIILQEYVYQVQGIKSDLLLGSGSGTDKSQSFSLPEQLVPNLKRAKALDRKNKDFSYQFVNPLAKRTYAMEEEPPNTISPLPPKTISPTPITAGPSLDTIDERNVPVPDTKPTDKQISITPAPVPVIPIDKNAIVEIPPIKIAAVGSTTEMYQRTTVSIPAVKIFSVTNSSFRIANPGKGSVLHFTAREPTVISTPTT